MLRMLFGMASTKYQENPKHNRNGTQFTTSGVMADRPGRQGTIVGKKSLLS